jgi:bifunctional DNA-binding transcriptional regulator/antitoxin component of YhaV-PrlF toxin-antitoxin module
MRTPAVRTLWHSRMSRKGQVTITVPIRRLLGVRPHDLVAFKIEGDHMRLRRSDGLVARTADIVRGCEATLKAEELSVEVEIAITEDVAEHVGH